MTVAPYPPVDGTQPCAGEEQDIFFPTASHRPEETRRALAACASCSFREPCAAYALTHDVHGIWGGTTRHVRLDVQARHRIKPAAVGLTDDETATSTRGAIG